jgi:hypothetical protein
MPVKHHVLNHPAPVGVSVFDDARFGRATAVLSVPGDIEPEPGLLEQAISSIRKRFLSPFKASQIAWAFRRNGSTSFTILSVKDGVAIGPDVGLGGLSDLIHRGGGFRRPVFLPTFVFNDSGPPGLRYTP